MDYVEVANSFRNGGDLSAGDSQVIWDEESRAWTFAKEVLTELGYANLTTFLESASQAENEYRKRLPNLDANVGHFLFPNV